MNSLSESLGLMLQTDDRSDYNLISGIVHALGESEEERIIEEIKRAKNVNQTYRETTPIRVALKKGNPRIIQALLEKGALVTEEHLEASLCQSLKIAALFHGHILSTPKVRTTVYNYYGLFNMNGEESILRDFKEVLFEQLDRMLLFWEGDINARMEGGNTLMHHLCHNYLHDYRLPGGWTIDESLFLIVFKRVLEMKPDLTIKNDKGLTPFTNLLKEMDENDSIQKVKLCILLVKYATKEMLQAKVNGKTLDDRMDKCSGWNGMERMIEDYKKAKAEAASARKKIVSFRDLV